MNKIKQKNNTCVPDLKYVALLQQIAPYTFLKYTMLLINLE